MNIALALSGGGFRATVFHLGVLARLAEEERLEDVTFLSTVSGGTLCVGLVHALKSFDWPTSADYIQRVVPEARRLLTTQDLQKAMIFRVVGSFWNLLETRADDLSELMQEKWNIRANLGELPSSPRWMINATCYETAKNWRFERFRMGDYVYGYTYDTADVPLSDAMAASAAFPGLIGPLVLDSRGRNWFKYKHSKAVVDQPLKSPDEQRANKTEPITPEFEKVHLWDGGLYDNFGLEGLHDFVTGWPDGVDFVIVSDAAGRTGTEKYRRGLGVLERIASGIMKDQIQSLRSRAFIERLVNHDDRGSYLQTGNYCASILRSARRQGEVETKCRGCLDKAAAENAAGIRTDISRLTNDRFNLLFQHGFEVADATLYAYNDDLFDYIGFGRSRWGQST